MKAPTFVPDGPAAVRLRARSGPVALMRDHWRDPDDVRPGAAKTAREVTGYRGYCPLRWSLRRHGSASAFTPQHIYAADRLRGLADRALYGLGGREAMPLGVGGFLPRAGPTAAALAQSRAFREFARAMALFSRDERLLVTSVVLLNASVTAWCLLRREGGIPANPKTETQRLVVCLDRLLDHYRSEIDDDLSRGKIVELV